MTKVFFAGSETSVNLDALLKNNIKNLLFSFVYIEKIKDIEKLFSKLKEEKKTIMIDSGAHTLQHKIKIVNYDKFFQDYLFFLKKYKKYIDLFVELDIDNVVGWDKVEFWRETMTKTIGEPIIVWHKWSEKLTKRLLFEEYCKKYSYIGIPNKDLKNINLNYAFTKLKEYKTKCHGFAMTKPDIMKKFNFTSVDSTSWLSGARYGNTYLFKNNTIKCLRKEKFLVG